MNPLKKYQLALALFVASSFLVVYLSLYVHEAFLVLFVVNILFWSWRAKSVRCVQCECPVAPAIGASAVVIFKSLTQKTCRNCGAKLD